MLLPRPWRIRTAKTSVWIKYRILVIAFGRKVGSGVVPSQHRQISFHHRFIRSAKAIRVPNPELFSSATDGPFTGFVGCIRALSIGGKEVSLENDIISGQSVGQCPDDRCSNQPCANGGLCQDTGPLSTDFNCTCRVPFTGVTCEIFNPCISDPCLNGGLCRLDKASTAGYRCICTALFIGTQCETPSKTVLLGCHIAKLEVECLLYRWKVFQSITFIFCRLVYCLAFQFYWC